MSDLYGQLHASLLENATPSPMYNPWMRRMACAATASSSVNEGASSSAQGVAGTGRSSRTVTEIATL